MIWSSCLPDEVSAAADRRVLRYALKRHLICHLTSSLCILFSCSHSCSLSTASIFHEKISASQVSHSEELSYDSMPRQGSQLARPLLSIPATHSGTCSSLMGNTIPDQDRTLNPASRPDPPPSSRSGMLRALQYAVSLEFLHMIS